MIYANCANEVELQRTSPFNAVELAKYIPVSENHVVKSIFFYDLHMQTRN